MKMAITKDLNADELDLSEEDYNTMVIFITAAFGLFIAISACCFICCCSCVVFTYWKLLSAHKETEHHKEIYMQGIMNQGTPHYKA